MSQIRVSNKMEVVAFKQHFLFNECNVYLVEAILRHVEDLDLGLVVSFESANEGCFTGASGTCESNHKSHSPTFVQVMFRTSAAFSDVITRFRQGEGRSVL